MWPQVLHTGRFSAPYSRHLPPGFVDYRDVAEVAAIALTCDRLACGSFELCAEQGLDRHAITAMMSNEAGTPIEAAEQTPEEWAATSAFPGTDREKGLLAKMYAYYERVGLEGTASR